MATKIMTRQSTRAQTRERVGRQSTNRQKKTRPAQSRALPGGSTDPSSSDPCSRSRTPSDGSKERAPERKSSSEAGGIQYVLQLEAKILDKRKNNPSKASHNSTKPKNKNKHNLIVKTAPGEGNLLISIRTPSTGVSPKTILRRPHHRQKLLQDASPRSMSIATANSDATRHPSLESLRQARLHHLEHEVNDSLLSSNRYVHSDRHEAPLIRDHAVAVQEPLHSLPTQPRKRGAPGGGSNPDVPSLIDNNRKRRKLPANVHFRLVNMAAHEIAHLGHQGYVVDILPAVLVELLPLSDQVRERFVAYQSLGQQGVVTGLGPYERYIPSEADSMLSWAYVSKLRISEIGADGRRSTMPSRLGDDEKEEHWTVALIPVNQAQLNDLRMHLALYRQYQDAA